MQTTETIVRPDIQHQTPTKVAGDFEKLFQMLEELGPASELFMVNTCDPVLERDSLFDAEEFE